MPDKSDRVEREIEEILRKIDDFPTEAARIRAQRKKTAQGPSPVQRVSRRLSRITASQLMLTSIALVLGSYFIVGQIDETVSRFGIIAGIILFFSSFALSFRPAGVARSPGAEKRWRGRVIDTPQQQPGRGLRLPGWWRRRR